MTITTTPIAANRPTPTSIVRRNRPARLGAILLMCGPLGYWLGELITAAAWQDPPYSPLYNWISNLGVPGPRQEAFGQVINSPLAWVMNTGQITYAALLLVGLALMLNPHAGIRPTTLLLLGLGSSVGLTLVALVPGSQANVDNGSIVAHLVGAQTAIVSGNLFAILIGASRTRIGLPHSAARASTVIGAFGLLSFTVFMIDVHGKIDWNLGMFERGAVYPILIGHLILAASMIVLTRPRTVVPQSGHAHPAPA
jgi:Protein of unknown function (DUF998)